MYPVTYSHTQRSSSQLLQHLTKPFAQTGDIERSAIAQATRTPSFVKASNYNFPRDLGRSAVPVSCGEYEKLC